MSRTDRAIGIALGLVIGLIAVAIFVFTGGGDSIDGAALDTEEAPIEAPEQPRGQDRPSPGETSEPPALPGEGGP